MKQIKITNENIDQNVIDKQYEQIGIRMPEGTEFSVNEGPPIIIGSTGVYEINLVNTNSIISSLIFTGFPEGFVEGYVDLVEKGYEGSLYGNVINPPKSIQKINEIDAESHNEIKFISGNGINIETNDNEIEIINDYPVGKISEGNYGEVFNNYSKNKATGTYSHAEGHGTNATSTCSHAEGYKTIASADGAHSEGSNNTASGVFAHVEGYSNTASASSTHVEGCYNQATEKAGYSHVEGSYNIAKAQNTHAEGRETIASSDCQHVSGKANIEDETGKYACIVGNGTTATRDDKGNITEEAKRSNAHTLDWSGNAWYQGLVQAAGFIDADGKPVGGITEITEDTFMADLEPGMYKINAIDDSYGFWLDDAYWWCLYEGVINIAYSEYENMYTWTFIGRDNMTGSTMATGKTIWLEDEYWYCEKFLDLYTTVESNNNKVNDLDSPDYITYPSTKAVADYVKSKTAPKVFEKIATYTVESDADGNLPSKIIINKDESGNDFELTDMYVEMTIAFNGSNTKFYMTAASMGAILGNGNWGFTDVLRKWNFRIDSYGEGNGGLITAPGGSTIATGSYPNANISTMSGQPIPVGKTVIMKDLQFIVTTADRVFKEGSTITIWGVRK